MLVTVKTRRRFFSGTLEGIEIPQEYWCDERRAPKVGEYVIVDNPIGGAPYVDRIVSVEPKT